MSEKIEPRRFYKGGFVAHFQPWIKPDGEPGDWYLVFNGRAAIHEDVQAVADLGYPRGPYKLTLTEVLEQGVSQLRRLGRGDIEKGLEEWRKTRSQYFSG